MTDKLTRIKGDPYSTHHILVDGEKVGSVSQEGDGTWRARNSFKTLEEARASKLVEVFGPTMREAVRRFFRAGGDKR